MKPIRWRAIFVSCLTLLAAYSVAPTIIYFLQPVEVRNNDEEFSKKVPSWLPDGHIKLGLDLQGGVQLVLGVRTEEAIENKLNRIAVELGRWAKDSGLDYFQTSYVKKGSRNITVTLSDESKIGEFNEEFAKQFPLLAKIDRQENNIYYAFKSSELERIQKSALEQSDRVIRTRVDQWGVAEPMINRRADGSILVQLPGFTNPEQAKNLLGRTAQLEFKVVDDEFDGFNSKQSNLPKGIQVTNNQGQIAFSSEDREALAAYLQDAVPEDKELLFSREQIGDGTQSRYLYTSYVVFAATELIGDDIQDAQFLAAGGGLDREPMVSLKLTALGAKRFADVTGRNVNKRLAIVLDNMIESAPVIRNKITGGNASITLGSGRSYNQITEEGTQLALILKSGAIPATITVLEERQVGASLGPELANQGIKGILVGLVLVLIFMLFYYRRPGIIACIALCLNALFLLAVMAGFGFALTLPGIAGFVLTLGMAVDANVLINERIRQEIREGKHPRTSVQTGFKKVFWTIIDANVTTLIAALVLLETNSSGPIRGFAVTLMIGLIVSLFTSLYCSHLFFDIAMTQIADKRVKFWLGGEKAIRGKKYHFNFLQASKPATITFIALGFLVLMTTAFQGLNLGVDFAGGTEVMVGFQKDVEAKDIRKIGDGSQLDGLSIQALQGGKKQYLVRYDESKEDSQEKKASASDTFVKFKNELLTKLSAFQPEILQVGFVGPQVGAELRNRGIISVLYAILAVLLYISLRFDMRFAPGAIVKMFLDIFVMLGFYTFFRASFDLVSVAAFLTVVGYSVNDTIVIYDRIRENLIEHPRRTLRDNINLALNETLSRTINTSVTTVASLLGILFFATGQIWSFAMAMTLGVIIATTSSTFVASSFVLWFEHWKKQKMSKNPVKVKAKT